MRKPRKYIIETKETFEERVTGELELMSFCGKWNMGRSNYNLQNYEKKINIFSLEVKQKSKGSLSGSNLIVMPRKIAFEIHNILEVTESISRVISVE
jgi:hypothetical protein